MEILEPQVGKLASADCMTDGCAERTGERELDDFCHAVAFSTFLFHNILLVKQ